MNRAIRFGLPLLAATAVWSTPALAQDRDAHFDGFYISGFGGVAAQPGDNRDTIVFDTNGDGTYNDAVTTTTGANAFSPGFCGGRATSTAPDTGCSNDKDRIEFGGRIGYDKRLGRNLVAGLLVEVSGNNALDGTTAFSTTPAFYEITRGIDHAVAIRGRIGFTPGGGALFYGTGGVSNAKVDHGFRTTNGVNTFTAFNDDKRIWGYQAGGGAEVMLTDHVSLGLEYLFNRYKDDKYYVEVGQGTAPSTNPFIRQGSNTRMRSGAENLEIHSLRASLSYRF